MTGRTDSCRVDVRPRRSRSPPATAPPARASSIRRTATVRTPAFVPLASTATVKSLHASEVAELGYDMVLGNTFHLFIQPGPRADRRAGRAARVHGLAAADHHRLGRLPGVLDGPRLGGRGDQAAAATGASRCVISIEEEGVRFRSYLDGRERFMGPETSMEVQAALGSDIALAFDECTPFHVERDYTAALDGAHAPLARPLRRLAPRARAGRPAALRDRAGRRVRGPARRVGGLRRRRGRRRHRDRRLARPGEGADARGGGLGARAACRTSRRATCSGSATWTTSSTPSAPGSTRSTAPPRRAWPATAPRWCPTPRGRWRLDLTKARPPRQPRADRRGCPCPACREHTRGYLHYLTRASELTAKRLLTLHNLTFMERLMRGLRDAIAAGERTRPEAERRAQRECSPMKSRRPSICCWTSPRVDRVDAAAARRREQRDRHDRDRRDRGQQRQEACRSAAGRRRAARARARRGARRLRRAGGVRGDVVHARRARAWRRARHRAASRRLSSIASGRVESLIAERAAWPRSPRRARPASSASAISSARS